MKNLLVVTILLLFGQTCLAKIVHIFGETEEARSEDGKQGNHLALDQGPKYGRDLMADIKWIKEDEPTVVDVKEEDIEQLYNFLFEEDPWSLGDDKPTNDKSQVKGPKQEDTKHKNQNHLRIADDFKAKSLNDETIRLLLSDGLTNEDRTNENEINKSKDFHTVSFEDIQKDGIKDDNLEGVTNGDDDFTVTKVTSVDDLKNNDNISKEQLVLENEALRKEIELKDNQLKEGLIMITQKLNKKFEEKNNRLIESQQKLVTKTDKLIADVTSLKNSPVFHACAYHGGHTIISERITYSKHLYWSRSNNQGTLDLNTGVFTSGVSGTYTIAWNLRVGNDYNDNNVRIFLRKNGENIRESRHYSEYTGLMGYSSDQGDLHKRYVIYCTSYFRWKNSPCSS